MIALLREAWASARANTASSILTLLVVAGMVTAVILTSGRTIAAEQAVLSSIDEAGTRAITVRAEADAGLTTSFLERISGVEGIAWAGAFSPIVDGHNATIPTTPVPVRHIYTANAPTVGLPAHPIPDTAYASPLALERLGMPYGFGAITLTTGDTIGAAPSGTPPPFLADLEPLALIPQTPTGDEPVSLVVLIAERPTLVAPLTDVVGTLLAVEDPSKATVTTSRELAELRAIVEGQLGTFSRGLVLVLVGASALIIAALLAALVLMRRKDFGRRRALGATRSLIVVLLLLQTGLVTALGITLGAVAAHTVLLLGGDPLPGWKFTAALAALTLGAAALATLAPAVLASRREPVKELRTP